MYNYTNYNQNDYQDQYEKANNYTTPMDNQNLINSYDGFIRGNMFDELYRPYIANEPFNLTPENEREALLNRVREYGFALVDIGLYLDVHPDDIEKITAYNHFLSLENLAKKEFESKYGPLTLDSEALNARSWTWLMSPWPWEVM